MNIKTVTITEKELFDIWHQIDEAISLLEESSKKEVVERLPDIQEYLVEARAIVGKYVAPEDSVGDDY